MESGYATPTSSTSPENCTQFIGNMRADRRRTVYAARCGEYVKIGKTTDVLQRMRAIGASAWFIVRTGESEGQLQLRYWAQHDHGEYFRNEGAIAAWFAAGLEKNAQTWIGIRRGHALVATHRRERPRPLCSARVQPRPSADPDYVDAVTTVTCKECSYGVAVADPDHLDAALDRVLA